MKKSIEKKNRFMFVLLVLLVLFIVAIFIFFISIFNQYDKNEYIAQSNSILYDKDFNYIKVEDTGTIKQSFDGQYYLYETKESEKEKYKLGKTAIVYNPSDSFLYLYGKAYQIQSSGDVIGVSEETKVVQTSPTKFFKLADRKYLIVDSNIKSINDSIVNAKGYLIIELDKMGNATFANNELNFKAIKPLILSTTTFNFDIANEKLIYDNNIIDLKNVIGSTNEYKKKEEKNNSSQENNSEKESDNQNGTSNGNANNDNVAKLQDYYDQYFTQVINSVNNLSGSVEKNAKTSRSSVNTNTPYYDFEKWLVLKNVTPHTSNIVINYQAFDPNSEYQAIFVNIKDKNEITTNYYLNKSNTEFIIRDLIPDREYKLSFGYQTNKSPDLIIIDEVTVKTLKPSYSIKVDKIVEKYINDKGTLKSQYSINYTLKVDPDYVLKSGNIKYYRDSILEATQSITKANLNANKEYSGVITLPVGTPLGTINSLKLENIEVCDGDKDNNCKTNIDLNVIYNFYGE